VCAGQPASVHAFPPKIHRGAQSAAFSCLWLMNLKSVLLRVDAGTSALNGILHHMCGLTVEDDLTCASSQLKLRNNVYSWRRFVPRPHIAGAGCKRRRIKVCIGFREATQSPAFRSTSRTRKLNRNCRRAITERIANNHVLHKQVLGMRYPSLTWSMFAVVNDTRPADRTNPSSEHWSKIYRMSRSSDSS
jgi:hypothetical protein